jgi:hypothetical protein
MEPRTTSSCLDAETVAAWIDGGLIGAEQRAAEAHAATCARCQALLATVVRSEPVAATAVEAGPAVPTVWGPRKWVPIGVAAGMAAAVIALAIWIPDHRNARQLQSIVASQPEEQPATPVQPPAVAPTQPSDERVAPPASKPQPRAAAESLKTAPAQSAPAPAAMPLPSSPRPAAVLRQREEVVTPDTVIVEFASPEVTPLDVQSNVGQAQGRGAGTGTGTGVGPAAAGAGFGLSGGGGRGSAGRATPDQSAASSTQDVTVRTVASIQWRIHASGTVERSINGAGWEPVLLDPPGLRISNGTAPLPQVCWLVGSQGVVLLTTDGRLFSRLQFPETVDLASVRATNARVATVVATDGRRFSTTDAGRTWTVQ